MQLFVMPLCKGLLAVLAISGVGRLALWPIADARLTWYWNLAFIMLTGQAAVNILVQAVLLTGGGSAHSLRLLAWALLGVATAGHFFAPHTRSPAPLVETVRENKLAIAILVSAWLTNLVVALAPSTKIDELYYHMLLPKRVVQDGALRFYLLPLEQAILPQMHFQMTLSIAHAAGAPDAGNVLSWAYSVVLGLFVAGFLMEATDRFRPGNSKGGLAILCAALCTVGLYATVWHTTGGAHALGDLATTVAVAGILWPETLMPAIAPDRYTLLLVTAAGIAASTKLSLWPLSVVAHRTRCLESRPQGRKLSQNRRMRGDRGLFVAHPSCPGDDLDLSRIRIVLGPGICEHIRSDRISNQCVGGTTPDAAIRSVRSVAPSAGCAHPVLARVLSSRSPGSCGLPGAGAEPAGSPPPCFYSRQDSSRGSCTSIFDSWAAWNTSQFWPPP